MWKRVSASPNPLSLSRLPAKMSRFVKEVLKPSLVATLAFSLIVLE